MLLCSPAGNDLLFDESLTEQGRNFGNKIWNAFRLVNSWTVDESLPQPVESSLAALWFETKLSEALGQMEDQFEIFRLSEALMTVYKLFWDEFSSWYLEAVKPAYGMPIDPETQRDGLRFLEKLMAVIHPFMPFITEEIWHLIQAREDGESLMVSMLPQPGEVDSELISQFELVKQVITSVRNVRNERNLPHKSPLKLHYLVGSGEYTAAFDQLVQKLANIDEIRPTEQKPEGAVSFIVKNTEYYIPLDGKLNVAEELDKLKKELAYTKGFLQSVMKKLSNERFVNSAPQDVVERENEKKDDAENKIAALEKQIAGLMG